MSESACVSPGELSFSEALEELESIVASLEAGQLELEESLARYQRGVELLQALRTKLGEAQQKVTALMGELESEPTEAEG